MPTYDYRCNKCAHRFSKNMPIGTKVVECETCGEPATKVFVAPAVHFSGSGFYAIDSKQKANPESSSVNAAPTDSESTKPCCGGDVNRKK